MKNMQRHERLEEKIASRHVTISFSTDVAAGTAQAVAIAISRTRRDFDRPGQLDLSAL
jgi:hypothetical protein